MYEQLLKFSKTYGPMTKDFSDWHKGRQKYAVWIVEVNDATFLQRYYEAQRHLAPYLIDSYQRKPHITLAPCGFLASTQHYVDDYCPHHLESDLEKILSLKQYEITAVIHSALISYAIAPGFEVLDTQHDLSTLNRLLARSDSFGDSVYFPHVTVGLYNDEWPTNLILKELKAFTIDDNIVLKINAIKLVSYAPTEPGGALKDELTINLSEQSVTNCSAVFEFQE